MKIYLDLLPEERKEEIKRKKLFFQVIRQEMLFTIPVLFFVFILVLVNLLLKTKIEGLDSVFSRGSTQREYVEIKKYEDKFNEINAKTSNILKIQNNHLNWLGFFYKLDKIVPENIYLSDLSTNNYQISLIGRAKTRDDFLKFQDKIKTEDCFSDVNVPLSNLVSKENVDFQIDFKIKDNCLKEK